MQEDHIKVYVKTDAAGNIISITSSIFLSDTLGWTEIDEGIGDRYAHTQGNYFRKPIVTESGLYCYKLLNGIPVEKTEEELIEEETKLPNLGPTKEERLQALENVVKELLIL